MSSHCFVFWISRILHRECAVTQPQDKLLKINTLEDKHWIALTVERNVLLSKGFTLEEEMVSGLVREWRGADVRLVHAQLVIYLAYACTVSDYHIYIYIKNWKEALRKLAKLYSWIILKVTNCNRNNSNLYLYGISEVSGHIKQEYFYLSDVVGSQDTWGSEILLWSPT